MVYSYIFLRFCCHSKDEKCGCWWGKRQELGTNLSQSLLVKHVGKWLSLGLEDNAFVNPKLWGKHPMWYIKWSGLPNPSPKLYDHDTSGLLAIVKSNNHNGSDFLGITPTNLNLKEGVWFLAKLIGTLKGLGEQLSHNISVAPRQTFRKRTHEYKKNHRSCTVVVLHARSHGSNAGTCDKKEGDVA